MFQTDDPDDTKHRLDPDKTDVETLVKHLWKMRKDFEKNKMKGFAIFPEASIDYGYVHLDSTALAHIFLKDKKEKFKREELLDRYPWIFKDGKRQNKKIYILPQELVKEQRKRIFESLFHLEGKIFKCRNLKTHHFRYSLQTDGVGVKLSFGKWREIPDPKLEKQEQKSDEADKAQDPKSAKKKHDTAEGLGTREWVLVSSSITQQFGEGSRRNHDKVCWYGSQEYVCLGWNADRRQRCQKNNPKGDNERVEEPYQKTLFYS